MTKSVDAPDEAPDEAAEVGGLEEVEHPSEEGAEERTGILEEKGEEEEMEGFDDKEIEPGKVHVGVEAADPNEQPVRPREWLIRYYINDLLTLPMFSTFVSKKEQKKKAMLGSKRLSLDSIVSKNADHYQDK